MRGQRRYALVLFFVMLIAALVEGFGLSLVLPLLSGLIGLEIQAPIFSRLLEFMLAPFPEGYKLEGLLAVVVLVFFGKSLLIILETGMSMHFAMRLRTLWASQIFSNYMRAPYMQLINQKQGSLVNNTIVESLNGSRAVTMVVRILSKVIVSIMLLFLLLMSDATMVITVAIGAGLIMYFLWNLTHRYSRKFGKERLRLNQETSAVATESLGAVREIKIYGAADKQEASLLDRLERQKNIRTKFAIFSNLPVNLSELVVIVFIAVILSYVHLTHGESVREFIPLLGFFVIVSQRLLVYVSFIISQRMKIISVLPSVELLYSLIHDKQDEREQGQRRGKIFSKVQDDIVLRNIRFGYEQGKPVFSSLNLTIQMGKVTGLIGPSGSGKSTIADLILRLFEAQDGEILVNGKDIREWDVDSWRKKVGYVSQEPFIFNASIRENILIGDPQASERKLIRAAKIAHIHDFVDSLPEGYETVVGDRGVKLSGGQKQRIAIARVIIRDPELYIFDEATSALDTESEELIQQSIETLSQSKTSLVIAHRLSTLKNADTIYELRQGGEISLQAHDALRARHLA